MKLKIISLSLIVLLFSILAFGYLEANAQSYLPVGPQTNVSVATVTGGGWTECYRDVYENSMDADTVLSQCPDELLMLSCLPTGSSTLSLLAQGNRSDVTYDTGNNFDVTHEANGVAWYFSTEWGSWGFVSAGEMVNKDNCDYGTSGDDRLCWHLNEGGFRCGDAIELNESRSFERIVYMATPPPPPVAMVPTLSEWGLIAMASILGIVGYMVIRRRKASA